MVIEHAGKSPVISSDAYVAPNAMVYGDVTIKAGTRILFGAQIIAEGGSITIGKECIVLENAVLRSSLRHNLAIGDNCLVGPNAHVVGCTLEDEVFVATGATVFHAAHVERQCEIRVNAVVHIRTRLERNAMVPIGWVAVGDPAALFPADQHDQIWRLLKPLNFPLVAYGIDRADANMTKITRNLSDALGSHQTDHVLR